MFEEIEIPADLSGLSVTELQALLDQVTEAGRATAAAAREAEGDERTELVATLDKLREAKANLTTALEAAVEAEAAENAAIEEAASEFDEDEEEETTPDEEDNETVDPEATEEVAEETAEPVAASGKFRVPVRAERRKLPEAREAKDANGFRTAGGQTVGSLAQLLDHFKRATKAAGMNGDGMARVARFSRFPNSDPALLVHGNDAQRNTEIMNVATPGADDLVMASGGFCGPGEVLTNVETCGRTDRPVGAIIASINARGKYRFVRSVGLSDVDTGIDYWTEQNDIDVDPLEVSTHKPCYQLECQLDVEAIPVGIPACFQYGVFQQWSFPEQVAAALRMFDVALARRSEALILQRLHEHSNQFTYAPPIGESVQNGLVRMVAQLLQLAGYNGRNSLDGYVLIMPESLVMDVIVDAAIKA